MLESRAEQSALGAAPDISCSRCWFQFSGFKNRRFLNAQQHSNSTNDPWATGSTEVTEAALTGISGMLFVCFLLSVLWLSSLRGIRSCGGRHGLGFRLGLLGLFVFRFLLLGFKKKLKNVSCEYNRLNG